MVPIPDNRLIIKEKEKDMKTINTAKTQKTKTYLWDSAKEVFGPYSSSVQFSFFPDIKIIVDAHLTAQQLDVVFDEIFTTH